MSSTLSAYLAQDRRHALAAGADLPNQTRGAALFADISGFTPLTEALTSALGRRRGVEALVVQLNLRYDALIAEVERYGGSVIDFSGDAISCWFDGDDGARAAACALELQAALARLGPIRLPSGGTVLLAMKVGVASGPARRLAVGDPAVQRLDVLVGATLERMAIAEHLAHRAEVVLSPEVCAALDKAALIVEWRDAPAGERFPVISGLMTMASPQPWPFIPASALGPALLLPWMLPELAARFVEGQPEPEPELRPVTALFLSFVGIDYERAPQAGSQLDSFVRWVQGVVVRHGGTLIQLSIGDKGSYMFIAFGAFTVHEDDARRAAAAALELRTPPRTSGVDSARIGISRGIMCVGAYGSASRRFFGALGDETNLAARLMQAARPGEVLVSGWVAQELGDAFAREPLAPLLVKGKRAPVPIERLLGRVEVLPSVSYSGLLIGRDADLNWLRAALHPIREGCFVGLVAVYGEAGLGKSRLAYELRGEFTHDRATRWLLCAPAELDREPLRAVRTLLRGYFDQRPERSHDENLARFDAIFAALIDATLESGDAALALELEQGRAFLAALADLRWDSSPYEQADPSRRLAAALAALRALLCAESLRQPLVIQVDDVHALDETGRMLLAALGRDAPGYPFAVLLTGRDRDDGQPLDLGLGGVAQRALRLRPLGANELRALARHILEDDCDEALVELLLRKTGGNPFFAEQLALDLRERGVLARAVGGWQLTHEAAIAVPDTITGVLVARLDRLPTALRAVTQTAAALGQEFDLRVLARMHGDAEELAACVRQGAREGLWTTLDERSWRFRHALLRDAAYEMQLQGRLRELHRQAAAAIEAVYGAALAGQVADLVYHARAAEDAGRERHYLELLATQCYEVSQFALAAANLERALSLGADTERGRARLLYRLARAKAQLGEQAQAWQRLEESLAAAEADGDSATAADAAFSLGTLAYRDGLFVESMRAFERSLALYRTSGDLAGEGRTLNQLGGVYTALDDEARAVACYEQALALPKGGAGRRR
jgi:adenylate cyclase